MTKKDRTWVKAYVQNEDKIARHAFYPFIHKVLTSRRFRRKVNEDGSRTKERYVKLKPRPISYCNHLDYNIYSCYSKLLSDDYEGILKTLPDLSKCITAYRRIRIDPFNPKSRNKCNIDFAEEVFEFIRSSSHEELVAITFDISSFFDNLDHQLLKRAWIRVLQEPKELPKHHYKVFRNITKFSIIHEDELFDLVNDKILVRTKNGEEREKPIASKKFFREKGAIAFCDLDFITTIRAHGLIKSNKYLSAEDKNNGILRTKGIPQGSPISSVLSNLYMLEFDEKVFEFVESLEGTSLYRRYSDDMVVVCQKQYERMLIDFFTSLIKDYKLDIHPEKTQVFHFIKKGARYYCQEKNLKMGHLQDNTMFAYLGFAFDGKYSMLKSASMAKYYRKMKRSIRRGFFYSLHNKTSSKGELFKSRLYKRFTVRGASRRRKYVRHRRYKDRFIETHHYDWGNFLSYAMLAARTMKYSKVKGQIKRHWRKFHELMANS